MWQVLYVVERGRRSPPSRKRNISNYDTLRESKKIKNNKKILQDIMYHFVLFCFVFFFFFFFFHSKPCWLIMKGKRICDKMQFEENKIDHLQEIIPSYGRSPPFSYKKCGPLYRTHGKTHHPYHKRRTLLIEVNNFSTPKLR